MTEQNMTPAQTLMITIAAAVAGFKKSQEQNLTYYDINLMLNSAWEVLSEIPTVVDESLDERISRITSELDDIVAQTFSDAEEHERKGDLLACRDGEPV